MLIQVDAAQLEWRVAVELSHDQVALAEIVEGQDTHSLNEKAFSLPSRLIAKIYLFRTIFRGSGYAFANDNDFMHVSKDPKYWDAVNEKFYAKYYGLDQQHKIWAEEVVQGRPIYGPLGHFWPIEMKTDYKGNLKIPWTILTNYPVQGTAAGVMSIARVSFWNRLKKLGLETVIKLVSSVHDSIVVDAPKKYLKLIAELFYAVFRDLQENIRKLYGYDWKTPLGCEVKYGPNMKDMTKLLEKDIGVLC
jgi:DNA polymerase I-like protein with 3'-5' exonuclease and polymerase domains